MTTPVIPAQLFAVVLELFDTTYTDMLSGSRGPRTVSARIAICGLARELLPHYSYPDIAALLTGKRTSHSIAHEAARKWHALPADHQFFPGMTKASIRKEVIRRTARTWTT